MASLSTQDISTTLPKGDDVNFAVNRALYFESVLHTLRKFSAEGLTENDIARTVIKNSVVKSKSRRSLPNRADGVDRLTQVATLGPAKSKRADGTDGPAGITKNYKNFGPRYESDFLVTEM